MNQCVSSLLSRGLKSISSAWAWSLADGRYRYWAASSPSRFSPVRSPAKLPHRAVRSGSHTNAFLLKVRGHYKDNLPASNYIETRTNNHWAYEPHFKESYWRHDQLHSLVEKPPPSPLPLWEQNLSPSKFWRVLGAPSFSSTSVGTKPVAIKVLTGIWLSGSLLWMLFATFLPFLVWNHANDIPISLCVH